MILCGDDVVAFVSQTLNVFPTKDAVGIASVRGGEVVAAIMYDRYSGSSVEANIWTRDKRPPLDWAACTLDYPFNQLKVNKLVAWVRSSNEDSTRLCSKLGFKEEGRVKNYYLDDSDAVILSLSVGDCERIRSPRWLSKVPK